MNILPRLLPARLLAVIRTGQCGQMAAFAAVFISLFMGALMFGIVNLTYAYQAYGLLDNAAFVGAEDGANSIDLEAWYNGTFRLRDPVGSCENAIMAQLSTDRDLLATDPAVACSVSTSAVNGSNTTVTATIKADVRMFVVGYSWGPTIRMTSSRTAVSAYGTAIPASLARDNEKRGSGSAAPWSPVPDVPPLGQ